MQAATNAAASVPDSEQTFERILEAALAELNTSSKRSSLSMRAVARRASVSLGSIYYYFQSKKGLLEACAARRNADLNARLGAVLDNSMRVDDRTSGAFLDRMVRCIFRFLNAERLALSATEGEEPSGADLVRRQLVIDAHDLREQLARRVHHRLGRTHPELRLSLDALVCCLTHFALWHPQPLASNQKTEDFLVRMAKELLGPEVRRSSGHRG